jgi:adenine phosphoribosyltransferase
VWISYASEMTNSDVRSRMAELHVPVTDSGDRSEYLNLQPWWRDATVLAGIGRLMASPFTESAPTVIIGPPASGHFLGGLVANHLGLGVATVRKKPVAAVDSDPWILVTTPPDSHDRHLKLGLRRGILSPNDRVLAIDDVVDTGGQLTALKQSVELAGAQWLGASVAIDLLDRNATRRDLNVRTIFHNRDL